MSDLVALITDLEGNVLASPSDFENLRVEIPLNDSRTAAITVSIFDPCLGPAGGEGDNVTPGDRMLKVIYRGNLVFWGQILTPVWDQANKTVELQAHDPTIRLKRHFHRYGDFVVGTNREGGFPVNGMGAKLLVLSAFPTDRQEGLGWPHPGIMFGIDVTTDFTGRDGPMKSYPRPIDISNMAVHELTGEPDPSHPNWQGESDALWSNVERSTNVWDSLQNVAKSAEGFDIDFYPIDKEHPPQTNQTGSVEPGEWIEKPWTPGFYCQMNCWIKQGNDRTRSNDAEHTTIVDGEEFVYGAQNVIFQSGFGRDNLDNFIYRPDASAMRNYAGVHGPGGEKNRNDKKAFAHVWVQASAVRYGQYHEWHSANVKASKKLYREMAKHIVAAYGTPPEYFELDISPERKQGVVDAEEPYRYVEHFHVGDYITAETKTGQLIKNLDGRIVRCTISQEGPTHRVKTSLECVPRILDDIDDIETGD